MNPFDLRGPEFLAFYLVLAAALFEAFLARIYTDARARKAFLDDPRRVAGRAGLPPHEIAALERIDREGLELAAASYARISRRGRG
jgi:hypothetical protein